MIDFGLSDEYLNGYNTRLKDLPFDDSQSDEWRMGWINANQAIKSNKTKTMDLAEKIYWILIEEGQHNLKLPLGSIITNTPDEVRDIIRKHINELT